MSSHTLGVWCPTKSGSDDIISSDHMAAILHSFHRTVERINRFLWDQYNISSYSNPDLSFSHWLSMKHLLFLLEGSISVCVHVESGQEEEFPFEPQDYITLLLKPGNQTEQRRVWRAMMAIHVSHIIFGKGDAKSKLSLSSTSVFGAWLRQFPLLNALLMSHCISITTEAASGFILF